MVSTANNLQEVTARLTTRKRSRSESEGSDHEAAKIKRSCYGLWKLFEDRFSGVPSDGEASVQSLQKYETDVPQDTPYDDTSSEYDSSDVVEIEYECVSDSDQGTFMSDISTGNEATLAVGAIAAVLCDSSLEQWFSDREEEGDSDNSSVEGDELERTKWRLCIQCKGENNNPLYRYCQECFQKRKELFPPRPKGFKKRDELEEKVKKKNKSKICSQDSGIGSFESDILETQKLPLKRKRMSISDFESENDAPKRLKLGATVMGSNNNVLDSKANESCHEVPVLKVHTGKDISSYKKSEDLGTVACVSNELDTAKKNKSSWVTKTVVIEENEKEDKQMGSTYKENYQFNPQGFAVTKELCMMCASVTKDSIFLHGITGHLACCYQCSIKTWKTTKCCPVCKAKVRNVVKIYS